MNMKLCHNATQPPTIVTDLRHSGTFDNEPIDAAQINDISISPPVCQPGRPGEAQSLNGP